MRDSIKKKGETNILNEGLEVIGQRKSVTSKDESSSTDTMKRWPCMKLVQDKTTVYLEYRRKREELYDHNKQVMNEAQVKIKAIKMKTIYTSKC